MASSGVSLVICCHNSERRLPETLRHLALQECFPDIPWEVVIVDNASTDHTARVARELWTSENVPLRVVREEKVGLVNARIRGFTSAQYETISFIDDDNWVCPTWMKTAYEVMEKNPSVGACGGLNEAVGEIDLPWWFETFHRSYAVGEQGLSAGDISAEPGYLFGAGVTIRKSAWQELVSLGFSFRMMGRQGRKLLCGEDYELCMALRLCGWKIWYEPEMRLKHFLPKERLEWRYLRTMMRSVGHADPLLEAYFQCVEGHGTTRHPSWRAFALEQAKSLFCRPELLLRSLLAAGEGEARILAMERTFGSLLGILNIRAEYNLFAEKVRQAAWNRLARSS